MSPGTFVFLLARGDSEPTSDTIGTALQFKNNKKKYVFLAKEEEKTKCWSRAIDQRVKTDYKCLGLPLLGHVGDSSYSAEKEQKHNASKNTVLVDAI